MKEHFMLRSMMTFLLTFLSIALTAQTSINGHVRDANGEPIIGATIRIVGNTDVGVVTNYDGNFIINAHHGDMLSIAYIGYTTANAEAVDNMVVTLTEDAKMLENVVVIGYGRAKKDDLTGSVTAIKTDDMNKGVTNSASDMLVGKIAGVDVVTDGGTPGGGAKIRIRGGSSLNASNDPLIVIDGLAIDNNTATGMSNIMAGINPADIETFTVLKDASATAIYGSRASNGVIIITTKKGRAGMPPKVTYNGSMTISTTQKRYEVLSGEEYRKLIASLGNLDVASLGNADTDWQDEIFRTSISHDHNISVSGGLKNLPYRISAGINSANGILKTSWMRRFNVGINLAPSFLNDHLKANINAKYMYEKNRQPDAATAVKSALSMDPTQPVKTNDATSPFFNGYYQPSQPSVAPMNSEWKYTSNYNATQNPVALLYEDVSKSKAHDFTGNMELDYAVHGFEDLHLHASYGGQYTESHQTDQSSPYSFDYNYYGHDGITQYYKYSITANAFAQYRHTWGQHDFDIMAGGEESHFHRNGYTSGQGKDPYTGEAHDVVLASETAWATHYSLVSFFGRLNYTLSDKYMVTATLRADGSSRFASGKRWGYFPSVALAWKISNEKWLKDAAWMDELKLRLGWGKTGQQDINSDFGYVSYYTAGSSDVKYPLGNNYYTTMRPTTYNPDLTWETTTTYNVGVDASVLNGRLSANLDAYYRKTTDLLNTVTIPSGTQLGSVMTKNIGSLENYGIEFSVNGKPIVTKDFTWDLGLNVAWNHNEITELSDGSEGYYILSTLDEAKFSRGSGTFLLGQTVGKPINSFFVYEQKYDDNGKPIEGEYVDRNNDGKINESDRYFYKSPAADIILGLTSKMVYRNWDFSFSLRASLGNYAYYDFLASRATVSTTGLYYNSVYHNTTQAAIDLGFTGTEVTENYLSDYFVRNASFLKCQNISIGYTFTSLIKSDDGEWLSGRVYATVENPFIITGYDGIDPEVPSGVDKYAYPRPMSVQIGLNLNF